MGYHTEFKGAMKFTGAVTQQQLAILNAIFGEDARRHPEWSKLVAGLYYIDLKLMDDFSGVEWDSATEKCFDMVGQLNLVIELMQVDYPGFALEGEMLAQGEDLDDRYFIRCEGGPAYRVDATQPGQKVTCPHCDRQFYHSES